MEAATMKEELHKLIDNYEDENGLYQFFNLMKEEKELDILN